MPQDRQGHFSTQLFERYQRSEKALVSALAEMYIQGVSTRKVKAITEELCGHAFSASAISAVNKTLDESLEKFAKRPLEEAYPYLVLDARYEKVREDGVIRSQAVQIAIGINERAGGRSWRWSWPTGKAQTSWKDFLLELKSRGLRGVEFVVSDDHPGLKRAIAEVLPEAVWQRCYVHFLRNALDHLPRKAVDDCLQELRWIYDRRDLAEAQKDLAQWLERWEQEVSEAVRVGGREHWGDFHLLPSAASAPQAHEVHQHAGTVQRGDQAKNPRGADLSRMGRAVCGLSGLWRWRPTRTGWRQAVTSIWIFSKNTRNCGSAWQPERAPLRAASDEHFWAHSRRPSAA